MLRLAFRIGSRLRPNATMLRGARLFSSPLSSSRQRAELAPSEGAREQAIDIAGVSIATYIWGDPQHQPYVLFAHGWSSHGTRIRAWITALRDAGYAVVAFDQVAHGKSGGRQATLPDFTDLVLGIGRKFGSAAAVIGHSLGGAAAALALSRGLKAERAILIAPAADPVDAGYRFARFVGMAEYLCRRMFDMFQARLGISFEEQQAQRVVPAIGRPALIVHDLEDPDVPWSEGERYARYWPDSRLMTTRGLGHRRIVDDPAVIAAGLEFLRGKPVGERVVSSPNLPYGVA
jgi:pimeloyl-ACP methyl ester carboxylesterase